MAKRKVEMELTFGKLDTVSVINVSDLARIIIPVRPIICKSCSMNFHSYDVTCFDYTKERVIVHCPQCKVQNLVLKQRSFDGI